MEPLFLLSTTTLDLLIKLAATSLLTNIGFALSLGYTQVIIRGVPIISIKYHPTQPY